MLLNVSPPPSCFGLRCSAVQRSNRTSRSVTRFAFAGAKVNPHEPHTVVWAGIVSEKLSFADYWNDSRFAGKTPACWNTAKACNKQEDCHHTGQCAHPDNFYRPTRDDGLRWVMNPVHGPEDAQHDTNGQYVLAFDPSWHFGANGPPLPASFGLRMTYGRRGERLADLSDAEWRRLEAWLNQQTSSTHVETRKNSTCKPATRRVTPSPPRGRC